MAHGSLQAELMRTKHNGRTNIYISYNYFGNIFAYIAKTNNNDKQMLWELYNVATFDIPSVRLT